MLNEAGHEARRRSRARRASTTSSPTGASSSRSSARDASPRTTRFSISSRRAPHRAPDSLRRHGAPPGPGADEDLRPGTGARRASASRSARGSPGCSARTAPARRTSLKLFIGLIDPDSGSVEVLGHDPRGLARVPDADRLRAGARLPAARRLGGRVPRLHGRDQRPAAARPRGFAPRTCSGTSACSRSATGRWGRTRPG